MGMTIKVLIDNVAVKTSLRAQHGLSLLVEGPWGTTLMDAGADAEILLHNAAVLGADLSGLSRVVLSHGHYDHTGGLAGLLGGGLTVYCGPGTFHPRYVERPGEPMRRIGPPISAEHLRAHGARVVQVDAPLQLEEGLLVSGPVGGPMWGAEEFSVLAGEELVPDRFADELFLMARGRSGWVVLTGCCHRGVTNTLRLARFLARGERLAAVIGGLHLRLCDAPQLQAVLAALREAGSPDLYAGHCTGQEAVEFLTANYEGRTQAIGAGTEVDF